MNQRDWEELGNLLKDYLEVVCGSVILSLLPALALRFGLQAFKLNASYFSCLMLVSVIMYITSPFQGKK